MGLSASGGEKESGAAEGSAAFRASPPVHAHPAALSYATMKVPMVTSEYTIGGVVRLLKKDIEEYESVDYVYIVEGGGGGRHGVLKGLFSSRRLYSLPPKEKVGDIRGAGMFVKVGVDDRPDYAAYLCLKHGVSAVPVVGDAGEFRGAIVRGTILSILHKKHVEDRFMHAGIHKKHAAYDDSMNAPVLQSIMYRLPWLIIGLFGGMLAADVIGVFEATLEKNVMLAAFLPMVVYIAGAVGTQLETFSIRDFALHNRINVLRYSLKQSLIVFIVSVLLGAVAFGASLLFYGGMSLSATVGISVTVASLSSILAGLAIPFAMRKMKKDPAAGSGPLGTIIQDILSVLIFFLVATALL